MKTVGELLKEARLKKHYSLEKVELETKIKKEFIEAIEKSNWAILPELPVTAGFVKNLASFFDISRKTAYALLKRDYPPKDLLINPKPDIGDKFVWTPRYTFGIGVLVVVIAILGYLGIQYFKYITPPKLEVTQPKEGAIITTSELVVTGKTDADAVIKINNQPTIVDQDGNFNAKLEIFAGTQEVVVTAISRSGKETIVKRKIIPKLK